MRHPKEAQPLNLLMRVQKVKLRNKYLSVRLAQVEKSRDTWKAKALARGTELSRLKSNKRRRRPPAGKTLSEKYGFVKLSSRDLEKIRSLR